jgi:hypothetical protein
MHNQASETFRTPNRAHPNRELWLAFTAILFITLAYLAGMAFLGGVPRASGLFGHSLGIAGFVLMLMTETLYSLRKRSRRAGWGKMSGWLEFHIFTGLVGPYLVLLHTSWKFNGLAGVTLLFTLVIVISGFIGRYIYTAVPRTADGKELEAGELEREIDFAERELARWLAGQPPLIGELAQRQLQIQPQWQAETGTGEALVLGRPWHRLADRRQWREFRRQALRLNPGARGSLKQIEQLLARRRQLERQRASLAAARRLLALWHTVHIPIGMALFTAALIHIAAAIYYATLFR